MTPRGKKLSPEDSWVETEDGTVKLIERVIDDKISQKHSKYVEFLFVDRPSPMFLDGLYAVRQMLADANIILVVSNPSNSGYMDAGDSAILFYGARCRDSRAVIPTATWNTEVALGSGFYLTPEMSRAESFRSL